MSTNLRVTELDFTEIKKNLKDFLRGKPEFVDYDFDGSTMSTLLDLLAYNTYYNAFYASMAANEMFLDSATIKESVYSKAKELNYLPRSARSARAKITVKFAPSDSPSEIIIPQYTKFQTTLNGVNYEFVTKQQYSVINDNGNYLKTVDIYEGYVTTYTFNYSAGDTKVFELPVENVDTNSIVVEVRINASATTKTTYTVVSDITEVEPDSTVYYLQKNLNGYYEIYFGDDVLGKALADGNVITVTFLATSGAAPNGIGGFKPLGHTGYNNAVITTKYTATVTSVDEKAQEGQEEETIDEIKFNAPRSYEVQNRLIVENDYKQYILNNYSDIQSVSVWGGETHVTPIYGKVLVAVKPKKAYVISNTRKQSIINDLKKYNAMSIDPLIIDPTFLFINTTSTIYYNATKSTLTAEQIYNLVATAVQKYETDNLGIFDNRFRLSRLSAAIDAAHQSIESNKTTITIEKRFSPTIDTTLTYSLEYQNPFYNPYSGYLGALSSTGFKLLGNINTLYLDDDGKGNVRTYYLDKGEKVYVNNTAGTINYATGTVKLTSFHFVSFEGDELRIAVQPDSSDIFASRHLLLLLSFPKINLYDSTQQRVIYSNTVSVLGNSMLVKTDGILNTVTL